MFYHHQQPLEAGCSSVRQRTPGMRKALGSIPSSKQQNRYRTGPGSEYMLTTWRLFLLFKVKTLVGVSMRPSQAHTHLTNTHMG